jgi:hypothetical protein
MATGLDRTRTEAFLLVKGVERIPHPGGTLFAHLKRVAGLLNSWSAPEHLEIAGLCHAVYGTDGFATPLVDVAHRESVQVVVGSKSESLIYLYASADRGFVYPQIGTTKPIVIRDRFTGTARESSETEFRDFMELTAANELDVITHSADIAARYGSELEELMRRAGYLLSSEASAAWTELPSTATSPSAVVD